MNEINADQPGRNTVWTWLLCGLLLVWEPLNLGLSVSGAMSALPIRGTPLGLLIVARVLVTALGIAAGLSLLDGRGAGRRLAQMGLLASAGFDVVRYTTSYYPSNRMPGDDVLYLGGSLIYHVAWLTYLSRPSFVPDDSTQAAPVTADAPHCVTRHAADVVTIYEGPSTNVQDCARHRTRAGGVCSGSPSAGPRGGGDGRGGRPDRALRA